MSGGLATATKQSQRAWLRIGGAGNEPTGGGGDVGKPRERTHSVREVTPGPCERTHRRCCGNDCINRTNRTIRASASGRPGRRNKATMTGQEAIVRIGAIGEILPGCGDNLRLARTGSFQSIDCTRSGYLCPPDPPHRTAALEEGAGGWQPRRQNVRQDSRRRSGPGNSGSVGIASMTPATAPARRRRPTGRERPAGKPGGREDRSCRGAIARRSRRGDATATVRRRPLARRVVSPT